MLKNLQNIGMWYENVLSQSCHDGTAVYGVNSRGTCAVL